MNKAGTGVSGRNDMLLVPYAEIKGFFRPTSEILALIEYNIPPLQQGT